MRTRHLTKILAIGMLVTFATACIDDALEDYGNTFEGEGFETSLSLKVSLPGMSLATRADMDGTSDSDLNSLWVGIFNARTGECTYAGYPDIDNPGIHPGGNGNFIELKDIKTKSGLSYIVAVGNPVNNSGYQYAPEGDCVIRTSLRDILPKSATTDFTWEKYKNIAIRQLDLNDITAPIGNLVMSGVYYGSETDPAAKDWETHNYQPVVIPAQADNQQTVTLPGAIHLRRLISQVKFQIKPGDYPGTAPTPEGGHDASKKGKRIISVIPQGYKVVNVPYTSWLHERKAPGSEANSGDVIYIDNASQSNPLGYKGDGEMRLRANYRTSASYNGNQYITEYKKTAANGTQETDYYEFDFWMLENKRRALTEKIDYDAREKEQKKTVEKEVGQDKTETVNENTGIYTALCGNDPERMNNCAAFVEIRCRIIYTTDGLGAIHGENSEYNDVEYRTADAVYTVHLGGIGKDWSDFTHRRNHKYTYVVTVVDVDRIIVEARSEGDKEDRPGIEGVVTDVINPPFEMDAHYGVANIKLSNWERTGGGSGTTYIGGKFPFRIRVYDGNGNEIFIDQDNYQKLKFRI